MMKFEDWAAVRRTTLPPLSAVFASPTDVDNSWFVDATVTYDTVFADLTAFTDASMSSRLMSTPYTPANDPLELNSGVEYGTT